MAGRKRKAEHDPTKSDSEDGDFDLHQANASAKKKKPNRASKSKASKPAKRARKTRGYSEDDDDDDVIEEDSDDFSEVSFEAESEEEEEKPPVNPVTGRRQRQSVAVKQVDYQEADSEEIEAEASESDVAPLKISKGRAGKPKSERPTSRPSLVLKLKVKVPEPKSEAQSNLRNTRSRTGSRAETRGFTPVEPTGLGTRRSSRISNDDQGALFALTDSGRHTRITRTGTATPEPQSRATRGGKGLKKPPSAIMEDSQEEIPASQDPTVAVEGEADILSQLREHARAQEGEEVVVFEGAESPFEPEAHLEEDAEEDEIPSNQEQCQDEVVGGGDEEEEDDDEPIGVRTGRGLRSHPKPESPPAQPTQSKRSLRPRKTGPEQHSDFEPDAEGEVADDNLSSSDEVDQPRQQGRKAKSDNSSNSNNGRRSGRLASKRGRNSQHSHQSDEGASELDLDEIADEAAELSEDRRRNKRPRRGRKAAEGITFEPATLRNRNVRPDYRLIRPETSHMYDDDALEAPSAPSASQRNRRGGAAPYRSLFSILGPFGGAGGPPPVFGGPEGTGAAGGVDSDSSDDDAMSKMPRLGGAVGMTPTSGAAPMFPQTHNADPAQQAGGGPSNFGKVKDRKALADADPLGVDPNVSFEGVGGLDDHIDRLKEMVALPLLYPEVFQQFKITPPRGVLFHGPPGTGKTLLARALASSVSSQGKKVTFYMRKGADALSKWVGEAERQLRLLFEEARKTQPSIIFFDEIDGLAPVRSSKQEQIHASIVATLLALMDGMDGRGQVVVIGATNRPDSVDPALRRPGRFDREFYFPLPNQPARRAIIDIHTKGWEPPLQLAFKDQLAGLTKGYGGADLRALCTEAALNAVQGTFPQIYKSTKKLLIDPTQIKVLAKDFMISVNKMVPSSERSASSGAAPLNKSIEPLLRDALAKVSLILDEIIPTKKRLTALEEAMYDDRDDELGFEKETMTRDFETARIFRPRLLIRGPQGMGQQYISAALLSKFEGLHVQSFDLPTLLKDSTRSPEAAVVQLFEEVKRHKPSVIYVPDVETWYKTLSESAIRTFTGLLRSLPPTDPVLLLGVLEQASDSEKDKPDPVMMRDMFGYSSKNSFVLGGPSEAARREYFNSLIAYVARSPRDFPDPSNRKKRVLEELPEAPVVEEVRGPTKEELKAQKKRDRHTLNMLKLHIQQVMDQIKLKYRKFRTPVIDDSVITYLYDEHDETVVTTDLGHEDPQQLIHRPYSLEKDEKGVTGLREAATGKFFYNLEIVTIEKRLSNGYYKRPRDFLADIKRLAKDARNMNDQERTLKANEMVANVEVDMSNLEINYPALVAECEAVANREQAREKERLEKDEQARKEGHAVPLIVANVPPHVSNSTAHQSSGPVHLGEEIPGQRNFPPFTPARLGPSPLSIGSHMATNGSTVHSVTHEDTEMTNSQDHSLITNPHEISHALATPSGPNTQHTHTQASAITRIQPGTDIKDYYNSASTTTSGQKTSERSNRSSAPFSVLPHKSHGSDDSRESTAIHNSDYPDFNAFTPGGGSQLPDTQPESSGSQPSQSSPRVMGPPPSYPQHHNPNRTSSSVHALLNDPVDEQRRRQDTLPPPAPVIEYPTVVPADPATLHSLHSELVAKSSGLSIEQLEQVMASLMDTIWNTKTNANRTLVAHAVSVAFNSTIKDIEEYQHLLDPSQ